MPKDSKELQEDLSDITSLEIESKHNDIVEEKKGSSELKCDDIS